MRTNSRINVAITAILVVVALIFPPWKDPTNGLFIGFYYVFSEEFPKINWVNNLAIPIHRLEIDYAKLIMEIIGIILMMIAIHSFAHVAFVSNKIKLFLKHKFSYLLLIMAFVMTILYLDDLDTRDFIASSLLITTIILLLGLIQGSIRLKCGVRVLDNEVKEDNIGNYANLIKFILLGIVGLGLFL